MASKKYKYATNETCLEMSCKYQSNPHLKYAKKKIKLNHTIHAINILNAILHQKYQNDVYKFKYFGAHKL